jgi:hypothetical protein
MEYAFRWSRAGAEIFPIVPNRTGSALRQIGAACPTVIPAATDCADIAVVPFTCRFGNL